MEGYPETLSRLLSGTPEPLKLGQTWALLYLKLLCLSLGPKAKSSGGAGMGLRPQMKAKAQVGPQPILWC